MTHDEDPLDDPDYPVHRSLYLDVRPDVVPVPRRQRSVLVRDIVGGVLYGLFIEPVLLIIAYVVIWMDWIGKGRRDID